VPWFFDSFLNLPPAGLATPLFPTNIAAGNGALEYLNINIVARGIVAGARFEMTPNILDADCPAVQWVDHTPMGDWRAFKYDETWNTVWHCSLKKPDPGRADASSPSPSYVVTAKFCAFGPDQLGPGGAVSTCDAAKTAGVYETYPLGQNDNVSVLKFAKRPSCVLAVDGNVAQTSATVTEGNPVKICAVTYGWTYFASVFRNWVPDEIWTNFGQQALTGAPKTGSLVGDYLLYPEAMDEGKPNPVVNAVSGYTDASEPGGPLTYCYTLDTTGQGSATPREVSGAVTGPGGAFLCDNDVTVTINPIALPPPPPPPTCSIALSAASLRIGETVTATMSIAASQPLSAPGIVISDIGGWNVDPTITTLTKTYVTNSVGAKTFRGYIYEDGILRATCDSPALEVKPCVDGAKFYQNIGFNFDDLYNKPSTRDWNDEVLCFGGNYQVNFGPGPRVVTSGQAQQIVLRRSHISKCNNKDLTATVKDRDGNVKYQKVWPLTAAGDLEVVWNLAACDTVEASLDVSNCSNVKSYVGISDSVWLRLLPQCNLTGG
jgi:hypothetical protein